MKAVLNWLFPPLCLHCQDLLSAPFPRYCPTCLFFFELLEPQEWCAWCFATVASGKRCPDCCQTLPPVRISAALPYVPPVASLVHGLKYGKLPHLAKIAAPWMVVQWFRLEWPLPDMLIPIPSRKGWKGRNHATLLAEEMAKYLKVPVCHGLTRQWGSLSLRKLSLREKPSRNTQEFHKKKRIHVEGKSVLLIDDVCTTGATLKESASALAQEHPRGLYGITLARV